MFCFRKQTPIRFIVNLTRRNRVIFYAEWKKKKTFKNCEAQKKETPSQKQT